MQSPSSLLMAEEMFNHNSEQLTVGENLGSHLLARAARALSLSFSPDPLIRWLYSPGARPWGDLEPRNQRWQERRIAWSAVTRIVVGAIGNDAAGREDCLGMMIVHPPQSHSWAWWCSPMRLLCALHLLIVGVFDKVEPTSIDEKVGEENRVRKPIVNGWLMVLFSLPSV